MRLLTISKSYISPKQYEQSLSDQGDRKSTHLSKCRFLTFSASPIVVDVTEEYTSKTCSKCGHIHKKLGGSKRFTCPSCGHKLDRDLNGAFNILLKALRDTSEAGILTDFQVLPYTATSDCRELPG